MLLNFWFRPERATEPDRLRDIWFQATVEFDTALTKYFRADYGRAAAGVYEPWRAAPHTCLALISSTRLSTPASAKRSAASSPRRPSRTFSCTPPIMIWGRSTRRAGIASTRLALHRRVELRFGRCRGGGPCTRGAGVGYRRVDPSAGRLLRHRGPEADTGPGIAPWGVHEVRPATRGNLRGQRVDGTKHGGGQWHAPQRTAVAIMQHAVARDRGPTRYLAGAVQLHRE
jgi:hypothetical protein